jgi:hypothetical protein
VKTGVVIAATAAAQTLKTIAIQKLGKLGEK